MTDRDPDASRSPSRDERADKITGIPWVYVTRAQAHAHPKGRLGPIEWTIAGVFLLVAVYKLWSVLDSGGAAWLALAVAIWPFLAGLGLIARVPWALVMAVISAGLTLFQLVRGLTGDRAPGDDGVAYLVEMLIYAGILFYLMDGERPNLIYRYRYRKYSVLRGDDGA